MDTIYDFSPEGVVVDAGDFPEAPLAVQMMDCGAPVVCCDSAAATYLASGRMPWRIVGDMDSIGDDITQRYAEIIRHVPDQETNDQTKAVMYLKRHGMKRVAIVGATGKREDHAMGNIALLDSYASAGVEARIYTDYGVFIPVNGRIELHSSAGTAVSVFSMGAQRFRSGGLMYPLYDFNELWQGTLNKMTGNRAVIEAEGRYLVYVAY